MKDKISKRWVVVGLIWAGVIFLTWWNIDTMDRIKSPRERREISHLERQFVQYHSENISSVLKKRALFFQSIESLKLGCLSVENQLRSLAAAYDLNAFKTECQPGEDNTESMPVKLSFQGSSERALRLLGVLQKDHPYLLIKQVEMIPYDQAGNIKFRILFSYRYRIASEGLTT
jgi:hypothetical protein